MLAQSFNDRVHRGACASLVMLQLLLCTFALMGTVCSGVVRLLFVTRNEPKR